MAEVLADPALYAFTGGEPPDRATLADRYARQLAGPAGGSGAWHNWIVRARPAGSPLGYVQATVAGPGPGPGHGPGAEAEVAWVVGVPFQGRGYATEAATEVVRWLLRDGVATVVAHIHPDHAASAVVARRIGLTATDEIEDGERVWRLSSPAVAPQPAAPRTPRAARAP